MGTIVCHKATVGTAVRYVTSALVLACLAAQTANAQTANWRRVGTPAVELMLASPATGRVERVWFGDAGQLFARTRSGIVFETADFEIWQRSANPVEPPTPLQPQVSRLPEPLARVEAASFGHTFALGRNLYRSDDAGVTWNNLTAFKTDSVIGSGQNSVAQGPNDQIVVANDFGVWRSMDGGQSWAGLNQLLPNLPVKRILSAPQGTSGIRVAADNLGALELPPGGSVWQPVQDNPLMLEAALLRYYADRLKVDARTIRIVGQYVYLGTSDGRILVSVDGGMNFAASTSNASGPVEKIMVDTARPFVALAAIGGPNAPHVLHTINGGGFWDALDGNLPAAPAHGIAAERSTSGLSAVYVATDKGVFWARTDLDTASNAPVWTGLSANLPPGAAANDVLLDPAGVRLYVALDGYGVYSTAAPHRARDLRLVNSADFSTRAAAPGGLLSVVGGRVNTASDGQLNYPVLAAADEESQIQVPFEATGPNVTLALMTTGGRLQIGMRVQPVSPAIFVAHDGSPMLQDAETGLLLDGRNAAKPGARVQVFATGLGRVSPDWRTGMPAPLENPPVVVANIRAFLNGTAIPVTRATLAPGYIGFYEVEVQLPAINNAGVNEFYITAGGVESNRVPIVIEQ